jgi:lipocalin-like protein
VRSALLHGHWKLVGWDGVDADGAAVRHGGAEPSGDLIYLPTGRMAVQVQHDGRPGFGSTELHAGDRDGRAEAYRTYIAYAGTFSVPHEGVVVHHVEVALHPDQAGMDKERKFTLADGELALETQRVQVEGGGDATSILRWRRR